MQALLDYIRSNMHWIFEGIGVAAIFFVLARIGGAFKWVFKTRQNRRPRHITVGQKFCYDHDPPVAMVSRDHYKWKCPKCRKIETVDIARDLMDYRG